MEVINATREPLEKRFGRELTTAVLPLETFFNAEDYHQKYSLQRHHNLMSAFHAIYPDFQGIIDSTAAARLNGFASGQGTAALFEEEKNDYGFSSDDLKKVLRR